MTIDIYNKSSQVYYIDPDGRSNLSVYKGCIVAKLAGVRAIGVKAI